MNYKATLIARQDEPENIPAIHNALNHTTQNKTNIQDYSNPQQGAENESNRNSPTTTTMKSSEKPMPRNHAKVPPNKKDPRKLFVGGLPSNVTEEEFHDFFGKFGKLADSVVMFDYGTRRSRGFGFITYEDEATARSLLTTTDADGKPVGRVMMRSKNCEIKMAEPREGDGRHRSGNRNGNRPRTNKKPSNRPVSQPMGVPVGLPPEMVGADFGAGPQMVQQWAYMPPGTVMEEQQMLAPVGYDPVVLPPGHYYPAPSAQPGPAGPAYVSPVPVQYAPPYVPYSPTPQRYSPQAYSPQGMPVTPTVQIPVGAPMLPEMIPLDHNGAPVAHVGLHPNPTYAQRVASAPPQVNGHPPHPPAEKMQNVVNGEPASEEKKTGDA